MIYNLPAFSKSSSTNLPKIIILFLNKKLGSIESVIYNELRHLIQWLRDTKLLLNEILDKRNRYRSG